MALVRPLNPETESPPAGPLAAPPHELELRVDASAVELERAGRRIAAAVAHHHALVWRTLRRFGVLEREVDDAAQQVFLAFAERLDEVDVGKEPGYLVSIAVRVAANARRKHARSPEVLSDDVDTVMATSTPEALLDQKQLREELDRGLLTLPLEQRSVFVLFELEGFSLPEIADSLGVPLGTATSRLRRARAGFEAWLAKRAAVGDQR
jgi:RNA polymerase sigma-70 factor (ECF subfamily)